MEDPSSMDQGSRLMGQAIEIGGVQPSCCLVDVELHMQIAGGLLALVGQGLLRSRVLGIEAEQNAPACLVSAILLVESASSNSR